MTRLEALKAALEAKREAADELHNARHSDSGKWLRDADGEHFLASTALSSLLTDDTIAALVAVAEAAYAFLPPTYGEKSRNSERLRAALAPLVKEEADDRV